MISIVLFWHCSVAPTVLPTTSSGPVLLSARSAALTWLSKSSVLALLPATMRSPRLVAGAHQWRRRADLHRGGVAVDLQGALYRRAAHRVVGEARRQVADQHIAADRRGGAERDAAAVDSHRAADRGA